MKEQIKDILLLIRVALIICGLAFIIISIGIKLGLNDKIIEIITWPLIISIVIIYSLKITGRLTSKDFWRNTLHTTKRVIIDIIRLSFKIVGIIILSILLIWIALKIISKIRDSFRDKSWTLFLYSSEIPDTNYLILRIDGYNSKTECLEKGFQMSKKQGSFECGYDCRYRDNSLIETCDIICNQQNCRN
jgi:hypothetical protein